MPQTVNFWFDPLCPWAWMTSRWIREAAAVRDLTVEWNVMSLAILNAERPDHPEFDYLRDNGWGPVRTAINVKNHHGSDLLGDFYTHVGTKIHPDERTDLRAIVDEALNELGLDPALADVWDETSLDDTLRDSHNQAITLVGDDVGTPIIAINDIAFFGPVVTPTPRGDAAGRLWDGVFAVASTPGFYELKRTRTDGPQFH